VGANAELVDDGLTGALVSAADSDALARAIVAYFDDPASAKHHGRAARQRAESRFSLERMVERYHRLYSELVREGAVSHAAPRAAAQGPHTLG